MKFLQINDYPNFLDHIALSSNDIIELIKTYKLSFPQIRNNKVEWETAFPIFLTPFYKFVYLHNNILTQIGFWDYFISENKGYFDDKNFDKDIMAGLKARIFRTYPSLVRDLHFSIFLKENLKDAIIIYNRKLDIEEGIDILIQFNNKLFGINLYTDTVNSYIGREKKASRHIRFDNIQYIELPVNFKESVKCGEFFLYGKTELLQITDIIYQ